MPTFRERVDYRNPWVAAPVVEGKELIEWLHRAITRGERSATRVGVRLELDSEAIARFCRKHGIRELSLFGSVLREDFGDDSDVDVLVQFEPGTRTGLLEYCLILEELEALLGRKVDLVTPDGLSPYLKDRILASREVVYARRP